MTLYFRRAYFSYYSCSIWTNDRDDREGTHDIESRQYVTFSRPSPRSTNVLPVHIAQRGDVVLSAARAMTARRSFLDDSTHPADIFRAWTTQPVWRGLIAAEPFATEIAQAVEELTHNDQPQTYVASSRLKVIL